MPRVKTTLANPQGTMGRPSARTIKNAEIIVGAIRLRGVALSAAAAQADLDEKTVREWLCDDQDFARMIARASSDWLLRILGQIEADPGRSAGLTWILSKHLRSYGDKIQVEHSGEIAQRVINPERLSELQARVGKASAS